MPAPVDPVVKACLLQNTESFGFRNRFVYLANREASFNIWRIVAGSYHSYNTYKYRMVQRLRIAVLCPGKQAGRDFLGDHDGRGIGVAGGDGGHHGGIGHTQS